MTGTWQNYAAYVDQNPNSNINKALTSASGVGEALIPEKLEEAITQTILRLAPEVAMVLAKFLRTKKISFNRVTSIPAAGAAMGEISTTPTTSSATDRVEVEMKKFKRKGQVSDFLQETAADYIDSLAFETENQIQAFAYDLQICLVYGNPIADEYTYGGLDYFIATHRENLATASQVQTSLLVLDRMITKNTRLQGASHRKAFLISPELLSQLSSLWTVVRDTRGAKREGTAGVLVDGGYVLETYRHVPFIETTSTRPTYQEGTSTEHMGAIALGSTGTGSVLGAGTYHIRVAPINRDGEQIASTAGSNIVITNQDQIQITFTAVPNTYYYKVYLSSTGSGDEVLVSVRSAFTYDANGTQTGVVSQINLDQVTPDTSAPVHMQSDIPLDRDGTSGEPMEILILWDLDEVQGLGRYRYTNSGGSQLENLIGVELLSRVDDRTDFLMKHYGALANSLEKTSYMVRGIRTA